MTGLKNMGLELGSREGYDAFMDSDQTIIISSIDSYHPISGLKHKLLAYRNFLENFRGYRDRICFIQFIGSTV